MPEDLRKKIKRRAQEAVAMAHGGCPKRLQKTPSQKNSERMRKKLNRGVPTTESEPVMEDCRNCPDEPCGSSIRNCKRVAIISRCSVCKVKALRRSVPDEPVYVCLVCRERTK